MEPKKTAIVIPSLKFGGNITSAVNIAKSLDDHDVTIIVHEIIEQIPYEGRVVSLDCPIQQGIIGKITTGLKRLRKLKKITRENRYDYVIAILSISNILNYFRYGGKKIVSCRDYGDLIRHAPFYAMMTRTSDCMVFNSRAQMDYFTDRYPKLSKKCCMIYNVVDIDRIEKTRNEPLEEDMDAFFRSHRVICAVGRMHSVKGFNNLVKAFSVLAARKDDAGLVILGDGPIRPEIEKLVRELNLGDKVLLPGFRTNPFKYVAAASVFTLPSFYEGFPNVLVEAMCTGTPVVAADCPSGPSEILCTEAGETYAVSPYGILTRRFTEEESSWEPGDITERHRNFAEAVEYMMDHEQEARKIAEQAALRVRDFSAEKIAEEWKRILS